MIMPNQRLRETTSPAHVGRKRVSKQSSDDGNITRKITACAACRKLKIKCDMEESGPPCVRCKKRGLSCILNRSLQMILEDDDQFKSTVADRITRIESALVKVSEKIGLEDVLSEEVGQDSTPQIENPQPMWDVNMEGGPAVAPGSILIENNDTRLPSPPPSSRVGRRAMPDLISKGIISLNHARDLFRIYQDRLDHFVYRVLVEHRSLDSIRSSSPLLTAAICTVGALHEVDPNIEVYHRCYQEFVSLCAAQTFSKNNTLDDVRALCIGAFWLFEISWILIGIGVRVATEMNLHLSIDSALRENRDAYLQMRVYFLVYICDHHFSIAYGRPPMSRDVIAANDVDRFLQIELATEDDARLISQVKIWSIATRVFDTFGAQVDVPLGQDMLPQLRRLSIELDTWRADWNEKFSPNPKIANYPAKGVGMHFQFAKLYLHSHAFRGIHQLPPEARLNPSVEEIAESAVLSAKSILRVIITDPEMQSHLCGLPVYFDTMIAFSVVFLTQVAVKYPSAISMETSEIFALIGQVVPILEQVTAGMHKRHLLSNIVPAIRNLLNRTRDPPDSRIDSDAFMLSQFSNSNSDTLWTPSEAAILQNYDLLSSQHMSSGFDLWNFNVDLGPPAIR